jgi:hypothetical protein
MIFSDLASPAEAGFAKAGNRYPRRIKSGAGFFGIMLCRCDANFRRADKFHATRPAPTSLPAVSHARYPISPADVATSS